MKKLTYKDAGVDIEAGYGVVKTVSKLARSTFTPQVLSKIGGFGGAFTLKGLNIKDPVLVSATDGVGTKIKLAFLMDKHDTIGIDLVAMNTDDVIACGAQPLVLLDYIACNKVTDGQITAILEGITQGCKMAGCALIGGETAEMSDLYAKGEYDLAAFVVGAVEKKKLINGSKIKLGDCILGLASSGLHSNGYTLARKVFFDEGKLSPQDKVRGLDKSIGEELLTPTRIYTKPLIKLFSKVNVKGVSHITGGGLPENVARVLPKGTMALIHENTWKKPAIFQTMQLYAQIDRSEMFKTFNMGIGMTIIVSQKDKKKTIKILEDQGETVFEIGEIVKGKQDVKIC